MYCECTRALTFQNLWEQEESILKSTNNYTIRLLNRKRTRTLTFQTLYQELAALALAEKVARAEREQAERTRKEHLERQRQASETKSRSEEARLKTIAMHEQKKEDAARMLAALIARQEEMRLKDEARVKMMEEQREERACIAAAQEAQKKAKTAAAAEAQQHLAAEKAAAFVRKGQEAEALRRLQEAKRAEDLELQREELRVKHEKQQGNQEKARRLRMEKIQRIQEQEARQHALMLQQQREREAEEARRKAEAARRAESLEAKLKSAKTSGETKRQSMLERMREHEHALRLADERKKLEQQLVVEQKHLKSLDKQELIERKKRQDAYARMIKEKEIEEAKLLAAEMVQVKQDIMMQKRELDLQLERQRAEMKKAIAQLATSSTNCTSKFTASADADQADADDTQAVQGADDQTPKHCSVSGRGDKNASVTTRERSHFTPQPPFSKRLVKHTNNSFKESASIYGSDASPKSRQAKQVKGGKDNNTCTAGRTKVEWGGEGRGGGRGGEVGGKASIQKELLRARPQREKALEGEGEDWGDAGDVAGDEECFQGVFVCLCVCVCVCM